MRTQLRFGQKLKVPSTTQIKHGILTMWLRDLESNQSALSRQVTAPTPSCQFTAVQYRDAAAAYALRKHSAQNSAEKLEYSALEKKFTTFADNKEPYG